MKDDKQPCVCQIDLIKPLTDTIILLLLQPVDNKRFDYTAGQYIKIVTADGRQMPFSIANAPLGARQIELHIRHTEANAYSNYLLNEIKRTGLLTITGPFGHCIYQQKSTRPCILMAGGTGFAPMKAIIEQALANGDNHPKHLYWGVKTVSDLYLDELPQQWAKAVPDFQYTPVLSTTNNRLWQGRTGLVHEIIAQDHPSLANYQVYAAGAPDMVFAALKTFQALGLKKGLMYSDVL